MKPHNADISLRTQSNGPEKQPPQVPRTHIGLRCQSLNPHLSTALVYARQSALNPRIHRNTRQIPRKLIQRAAQTLLFRSDFSHPCQFGNQFHCSIPQKNLLPRL